MKIEAWYSVVVRDPNGKVISQERRKSKSFLKQWNQGVYMGMSQVGTYQIRNTANVLTDSVASSASFQMNAAAADANYGIVVGTGVTAVAVADYRLAAKIANGSGAGQMNHLACSVALAAVSAPNCDFLVSRSIVNNSGGLITVTESGIYVQFWSVPQAYFCGLRDVFAVPQDVPDGGSITVNYTVRVTV